ncbi:MAG: alanine racemase, partial [Desulfovibrionaceae bacterium]
MHIPYNKIEAAIDLDAIRHNWRLMNHPGGNALAVVKSDAYGHGLVEVSRALAKEGARDFAVGTVEEGVLLRESSAVSPACRVISLLGPVDRWEYEALARHDVLPFIGNFEQLERMAAQAAKSGPLPLCLKFETGMARLGFTEAELDEVIARLQAEPNLRAIMASSHLATGDDPGQAAFVTEQQACFARCVERLRLAGHAVEATLANSGAILAHPGAHHQLQRAGVALYGTNPFRGTPWEAHGAGLRQAMSVSAPVLAVRSLQKGQTVSYGRTFAAPYDMRIAIIGVGYADNYSRGLSNKGAMCLHGARVPIVGRVCMQMTAVDLTPLDETGVVQAKVGDRAWLLGGEGAGSVSADELAYWWGTITYEVFC